MKLTLTTLSSCLEVYLCMDEYHFLMQIDVISANLNVKGNHSSLYFLGVMLFVQDSAVVEEGKESFAQSPGPNTWHEAFSLETQDSNCSELRGKLVEDASQNNVDDTTKNTNADYQSHLSKFSDIPSVNTTELRVLTVYG